MLFKTIRSQIALYLSILLFSGMLLIALTALFSFQNIAAAFAVKNFSANFQNIAKDIKSTMPQGSYALSLKARDLGACRLYFIDSSKKVHDSGFCRAGDDEIPDLADAVLASGKTENRLLSSGPNIPFFTNSYRYMAIAGPIHSDSGERTGSLVAVWDFDVVYSGFARIERLLFVYVIINTLVLVLVGVYQIGNITAKPMKKILRRTESAFHDDLTLMRKKDEGSDLDQLSASVGMLVDNLESSRKHLEKTVSELETANSNMEKMQKEIVRAEKMASIGRLSAGIAHEIGNPVGIISGYLEMLKADDIDPDDRMDFAERASSELKRIDSIIRELLDYARPSDRIKCSVHVHQLVSDMVKAYDGSRALGKIRMRTLLDAANDLVMANPDQLRQVFMNLAINASDAISESKNRNGGVLAIETFNSMMPDCKTPCLVIAFRDNGCGLKPGDIENVFDPFFTTKPSGKGTGLGLSVSLMMIEEAGGTIRAFSENDSGSEFRVLIPLVV